MSGVDEYVTVRVRVKDWRAMIKEANTGSRAAFLLVHYADVLVVDDPDPDAA